jgi:hypothetical protein
MTFPFYLGLQVIFRTNAEALRTLQCFSVGPGEETRERKRQRGLLTLDYTTQKNQAIENTQN